MFGQTAIFNGLLTGRISKFLTEAVLHIPGMYQKSAVEGPADVHISPKKPISAIFRGVCTSVPHCRALSVHISGMYSSTAYVHPTHRSRSPLLGRHISGMYQKSAAEGPVDVHTSPKKLFLAIFRWVCTRVPHCRALSVYMSGMYKQRSEAKGTGASKSKKIVIFVRRT